MKNGFKWWKQTWEDRRVEGKGDVQEEEKSIDESCLQNQKGAGTITLVRSGCDL